MFTAANAAAQLGWATRLATRGQPRPLQIIYPSPSFPYIHKDTRQPGCVSIYRRSNVRQLSTSTQCMCVCVSSVPLCLCVCVIALLRALRPPDTTFRSRRRRCQSLNLPHCTPPHPPLGQNTNTKCKQCRAKKNNFRCLLRLSHPLCVSRSSASSISFLSNCGKRAPSRILFCSVPVVVAALKQINLANIICCCCCGRRAADASRRQLKRHAELQPHTGCLSLSVSLSYLLSQRCQLHVGMQAISTTKSAIKVKTKEKTLRYVIPYLGTAYTRTVYTDNYGGSATPCICGLSNTINSPHYATFRNTVIEPPRQLDKSSSNPINNCMQKQNKISNANIIAKRNTQLNHVINVENSNKWPSIILCIN